jgi:hypothetical protein
VGDDAAVSDPEETAPFTHQPYGEKPEDNPFVSPSGPAAQPPGPAYAPPPVPPPPMVPYGQPQAGYQQPWSPGWQSGWPPGWAPGYGAPHPGSLSHKGATTALVLGIVSIVSLLLTPFCCITLPGIFCAPFAWWVGAKAKREIERTPGLYGNLSAAVTGMWMGIVMTFLDVLAIAGFVALAVWVGYADPTLV